MLTRAKHKHSEGTLKNFNPKVGRASRRKKMAEEDKHDEREKNVHMVFYCMSKMFERMYGDYKKRMKNKGKKKEAHADDDASVNHGAGGYPPKPPSSPLSSSYSSCKHSHNSHHYIHKAYFKKSLLNLDVKFSLPMFNGDVNHENLDKVKVQLASLQLEGTALVWWKSKLYGRSKCGNFLSSWSEFKSVIRKQIYPLGYLHKTMME
jgi:hypothetical protein